VALDPIDEELLRLLRENARMSYQALGTAVGLSANAAADRVRRLERDGVIAGFTVVTRPGAMGRTVEALVGVRLSSDQADAAFEAAVARLPAVVEDVHLTGGTDHQLRVACRDVAELNRLLRSLRALDGVAGIETRVILHQAIDRRG
jgi:Lrp/AsnC family leucine-responsive transcriptional regulator